MLSIFAWIFIILGSFFIISSILGLFRFPDFFTKIHAVGVADSLGIPLCLFGFSLIQSSILAAVKILVIILLFFLLSPASNHAIIKAAWLDKNKEK